MALQYHGSKTIGACIPLAGQITASASVAIQGLIAELAAKLQGYLNVQAALTLTLPAVQVQATIAGAYQVIANLSLAVVPPSASLQLAGAVAIIAELTAQLGALNAALDLVADLNATLAKAGVHLYTYTGTSAGLGQALQAATSTGLPGGDAASPCAAVILATDVTATAPTLGVVFGAELSI